MGDTLRWAYSLRTLLLLALLVNAAVRSSWANRCGYAPQPKQSITIWKYPGEDVTLPCTGHAPSGVGLSLEFRWYKEDYDCQGMNRSTMVASITTHLNRKDPKIILKDPERMTMETLSGKLTIRNLTQADESAFTCIFSITEEHISTVHLKVKELEEPVIKGLPDVILEEQTKDVECEIKNMNPTQGFARLTYNGTTVRSKRLEQGQPIPPIIYSIKGEPKSNLATIKCEVVQNVSGEVRTLSSTAQVTFHYPYHTKVMSPLPDQPINATNVTLTCDVTRAGNPPGIMKYSWKKDGQGIAFDEKVTLSHVSPEDSGSYKCYIQNAEDIVTPDSEAEEYKMDVVPLKCLPIPHFEDIHVEVNSLNMSWHNNYECKSYNPDAEVIVTVQKENETKLLEVPHKVMASQKGVLIPGTFDPNKNYMVSLILKNFPERKVKRLTKATGASTSPVMGMPLRRVATLAGYILLGCCVVVVVACILSAMYTESKRRASQRRQFKPEAIPEDPYYEDLDNLACDIRKDSVSGQSYRNRLTSFSGSVRYCSEGFGMPGLILDSTSGNSWSRSSSSSETPPPPPVPDFGELIGSRPMEPCPLSDRHYNNRLSIVAHYPRKNSISVKTEATLESLLEDCQDSYGLCPKGVIGTPDSKGSEGYIDMQAALAEKQKLAESENKV